MSLRNEPFGEESGEDQFDMDSLVSVNADVLQDAFGFNEDAFSEGFRERLTFRKCRRAAAGSVKYD